MKKTLLAIACALGFALSPTPAAADDLALDFGDAYYVGHIVDGIPSNEADEAAYINLLITLAPGAGTVQLPAGTGEYYDREDSINFPANSLPTALVAGAVKDETAPFGSGISVSGVKYVLGKYDASNPGAGAYVWYVGGLTGTVSIPTLSPDTWDPTAKGGVGDWVQYGLSHTTTFGGTECVPDGGSTLMLLGAALFGLGTLRRRFGA